MLHRAKRARKAAALALAARLSARLGLSLHTAAPPPPATTCHAQEHFGDDARGKRSAFYFLVRSWPLGWAGHLAGLCISRGRPYAPRAASGTCPCPTSTPKTRRCSLRLQPWHFNFFCRYRPLPEATYGPLSLQHPLLATRWASAACEELGETLEGLDPLERLLRCESEAAFGPIAEALWDAGSDGEAEAALRRLAAEELAGWEAAARAGGRGDGERDDRVEG